MGFARWRLFPVLLTFAGCGSSSPKSTSTADGTQAVDGSAATSVVPTTCLVTLATGQSKPTGIAVDEVSVYWTDAAPSAIRKVPLNGGSVSDLVSFAAPAHFYSMGVTALGPITVKSGMIYGVAAVQVETDDFDEGTEPIMVPVDGGGSGYCADCAGEYWKSGLVGGVTANATGTFAIVDGLFFHFPNATFQPSPTSPGPQVASDDTYVYTTTTTPSGTVQRAQVSDGSGLHIGAFEALASDQDSPSGVAVDGEHVYWTTAGSGLILSMPKAGGGVTTLASGQTKPYAVAVNATGVYWTSADGTVKSVPASGGTPVTVASGEETPGLITADATSVYWVDSARGAIWKFTPGPDCR